MLTAYEIEKKRGKAANQLRFLDIEAENVKVSLYSDERMWRGGGRTAGYQGGTRTNVRNNFFPMVGVVKHFSIRQSRAVEDKDQPRREPEKESVERKSEITPKPNNH